MGFSTAPLGTVLENSIPRPTNSPTNQSFTVTPGDAAENTVSDNDAPNRGARQYSVSGLTDTQTYDIQLYPAGNVTVSDTEQVSFADNNENSGAGDGEADLDTVNAFIEVVNGAGTTGTPRNVEVNPVNGTITFTIDSTQPGSVVPVVFVDTENDGTLELDANNEPTEDFGIGGEKTWIPEEAAAGALGADDQVIQSVDKVANRFITGQATYFYDSNDTFFVVAGETATTAATTATCDDPENQRTLAQFEAELSVADQLDESSIYQSNEELSSVFCLEDLAPTQPGLTLSQVDDDSIKLTVTHDATADEIQVFRALDADNNAGNDDCSTTAASAYSQVATVTPDSDGTTEYTDTGLEPAEEYCYYVTITDGGETSAQSAARDEATLAAGATAEPESTDARVITDATFQDELSDGDVWRVVFSRTMEPLVDGDTIRVQDPEGELANIQCDTGAVDGNQDANCEFNQSPVVIGTTTHDTRTVLTVTFNTTTYSAASVQPDNTITGANGALDYPLVITNQSGFAATVGSSSVAWTPTDDPDRTIDKEAGTQTVQQVSPYINSGAITTDGSDGGALWNEMGDQLTLTWSEATTFEGTSAASITEAELEAILGGDVVTYGTATVALSSGNGTVTWVLTIGTATMTNGGATGETVDGSANANAQDLDGNNQVANPNANPTITDGTP